jgi:ATP-dependent exoDNAse (exonuclease V) beta subunit
MTLIDGEQRKKATDPSTSFIVQAPAGSGKTEILTQRYLRLLGTVTAPEQIIALTFTRKAASEMRERIILALQQAAANQKASSAHQQATLGFAQDALHRDAQYEWNLLQQPNRLKIITIDSLCQSINQAIPLLEQQIAYAQITDKPEQHYLNAARQCIQFALQTPNYQQAIKTLLLHVDNKQYQLLRLFKDLLMQRDQWLSSLFQARYQDKSVF